MSRRSNIPAICEVEWLDSMMSPGWDSEEKKREALEKPDILLHRTAGYLIAEGLDYVAFAESIGIGADNVADIIQIPRVAILRMTELRAKQEL